VGNFVNYLRVGELIVLPAYGLPEDAIALARLRSLCPDATVIPLDCKELAREGGVLQCTSWTTRFPATAF
jgi:agmatine deiminase